LFLAKAEAGRREGAERSDGNLRACNTRTGPVFLLDWQVCTVLTSQKTDVGIPRPVEGGVGSSGCEAVEVLSCFDGRGAIFVGNVIMNKEAWPVDDLLGEALGYQETTFTVRSALKRTGELEELVRVGWEDFLAVQVASQSPGPG
jgi:hypothetical protein